MGISFYLMFDVIMIVPMPRVTSISPLILIVHMMPSRFLTLSNRSLTS